MFTHKMKHCLATIAALLCSFAVSAADFSAGGIFYNIISDTELTVEVTDHGNYSNNYSGSVTIPSTVTFRGKVYRVKSIGMYAFYYCPNLTSVVIPNGVESIGERAFGSNRNLTSITIPASVTEIGSMAFYDTAWLDKQPDGVVYAGSVLYDYKGTMPRNTSIEIKEGTASIAQGAFSRCTTLVSITIPESVTSIGGSAFYGCSSLYEIAIPDGVKLIGNGAFEGSGWYNSQPDGVVYAGKVLYDYKGTMPENTSIEVKKGTTSVAERAFSGCSNLTSITLPEGVASIGEYAFYGCSGLTSITLSESVTSIGESAFHDCSSLSSITIPEGVTSIKGNTFYNCSSLSEITIPDGVTEIGWSAFYGCSSLASINIPSSVTEIGNGAFGNTPWYDSLGEGVIYINNVLHEYKGAMEYNTSIEVREGTVSISSCAFYGSWPNDNSLKSVTIPASVTKIGSQAFYNCRSLQTVNFVEDSKLTTIEHSAFLDCWSLTSINIPQSVVLIDNSVFASCSDLAEVTLPEDMTVIASGMFAGCSSLKAIDIPKNVVCIGDDAFEGCSKLKTITIPSGVTKVRDGAFKDCSGLTSILCRAWTAPVCGSDVFSGVDTSIPVYVPSTYSYQSASGWSAFTNMHRFLGLGTCGDDLTWHLTDEGELVILGTGAMRDYESNYDIPWYNDRTSITKLIIDEGVTAIGARAFRDCNNLTSIICKAKTPPVCQTNTFTGVSKSIPLHVPEASIAAYQSAETWKNFTLVKPLIVASGACGDNLTWYLTDGGELVISGTGAMTDYTSYSNKAPWNEYCRAVVKVTINEGVTSIGDCAFYDCSNMVSVIIPESVTEIGSGAFSALSAVHISSIEAWCKIVYDYHSDNPMMPAEKLYLNGEEVTEVVIPEGMTSICFGAFAGAEGITSVTLPNSITEIGALAFAQCVSLADINIPEKVTTIMPATFAACVSLTEFTIPDNVTVIGPQAFVACSNLATVTIPKSVTSIGGQAFGYCNNLSDVYCYAENLPTMDSDVFYDVDIDNITLHVPAESVEAYRAAAPWCDFYEVVPMETLATDIILSETSATLIEGETLQLSVTIKPEGSSNQAVIWSTTNKKVATVDNNGMVTAIAPGTAIIIATAIDGSGVSASCVVTVEAMPTEVEITIGQYGSGTYCSKYALDFSSVEGLKAYAAAGYNSRTGVVTLLRLNTSQPGEGIFIKGEPGKYMVPIMESTDDHTINMLVGTLTKTSVNTTSDDGIYANYKYTKKDKDPAPMFYQFTDGSTVSAGKAYLQIPMAWLSTTGEARSIGLRFDEGEGATDIENPEFNIQNSELVYDLYGRKVDNPTKGGIYIVNGKKIVY